MCPGHFPVTFRSWLRGRQSSPNWEVPAKEFFKVVHTPYPPPLKALIPVWTPVQRPWAICWNWLGIHFITVVPNLFGTRNWFHGRQFFHGAGVRGDGFRMIQGLTFTVNFEVKWSELAQSCPTICNPVDCSWPGSSVHGILQARILEWVAISFSRESSQPRDQTLVSCMAGRCFILWATREFPVNFTSNLMLTLVWQAVPVHSLEVGDPCSKGLDWCVLHSDFLRNWPYHLSYAISSRKWGQI